MNMNNNQHYVTAMTATYFFPCIILFFIRHLQIMVK